MHGNSALLEFFGFGRSTNFGFELLLFAQDFLLLHENLLGTLNNLDLHLLFAETLLRLGGLQFVRQLCLGFLKVITGGTKR